MKTPLFPIRAVSKQTGISIDTLRAWERRYQVVTPRRGERGRLFSEADVRRLRLLRAAVEQGHSIGQLAELTDPQLQKLLTQPTAVEPVRPTERVVAASTVRQEKLVQDLRHLLTVIEQLDYAEAERELSRLTIVLPPRELVHLAALPLMQEVGEAWQSGRFNIAQEHMASALLRNLLGALVPLYRRTSPPAKLLLATPTRELHELGILLSAMLTAGGGLGIIYLGTNLPEEEIIRAAQKTAPQAVILGMVGVSGSAAAIATVQEIADRLPAQIELWIGGLKEPEVVREVKSTRALVIEDFEMLEQHLTRLGARF